MNKSVSIIVVTCNRLEYTKRTMDSLFSTTVGHLKEIIVIDNNSSNDTIRYLTMLLHLKKINRLVLLDHNEGSSRARNIGADLAGSDMLVFTDNDVVFGKEWLRKALACFNQHDDIGMLGLWKHPKHKTISMLVCNGVTILRRNQMPAVAMMIRKKQWEEIGGMKEGVSEYGAADLLMNRDLQKRGYIVAGTKEDLVDHIGDVRTDGNGATGL